MNSETKISNADTGVAERDIWIKPEIVSFEPISGTENSPNNNPGDILSSAS